MVTLPAVSQTRVFWDNSDGLRNPSLLLEDDVVLLVPSNSDLQLGLGQFRAEWEAMEMRIKTSKPEVTVRFPGPGMQAETEHMVSRAVMGDVIYQVSLVLSIAK